ncbi:hypothetical protein [Jiangella alkaliphila]|uniref:hypothetical protein n=1 Tax=Jiangella alkaliphila TaxID=419479 RepID=UPI0009E4FB78
MSSPAPRLLSARPEPERGVRLHFLDRAWTDHLEHLAHLRESTTLRPLSGKAPAPEYNTEAVRPRAFETLLAADDDADELLAAHAELDDATTAADEGDRLLLPGPCGD